MKKFLTGSLALGLLAQFPVHAEPKLYPTGPAEDAAFIRFVDAVGGPLEVRAGKDARIELSAENSSTSWQAVKARAPLGATLSHGGKSEAVEVSVQPSEFVTVAAIPDGASGWKVELGRESPTDFSAFKVSLGLLNLATDCPSATIKLTGKDVAIVEDVAPRAIKRRQINPVALGVDLYCQGRRTGTPTELGSLRAGERWTLLVRPTREGPRIMPILDRMP
ncbi:MAG: alginate O-acetyltransferase AlgF [Pseudomonadota bacterium]